MGEYASTGTLTATNVFGANGLISRRTGGSSVFYAFDDRGNAIQSLNASGSSYYMGSAHETEKIGFFRTLGENGRIGTVSAQKQA